MSLESLPNETLLDLFEYLLTADLLHAFDALNIRFTNLISIYFQTSRSIDCRSISKSQFDFICQNYVPSIADRIISLHLSNDDETPEQINRFFSLYNLQLDQFIRLRSLSFSHLRSEELMEKIMNTWSNLPYLTHLKFNQCYLRYQTNDVLRLMNSIWSLSNLTHCHFDITFPGIPSFVIPTVISTSLESLSIQNSGCQLNQLSALFRQTIRLRHFYTTSNTHHGTLLLPLTTPLIISLKLKFSSPENTINVIIYVLKNMNNLRRLTIETLYIYIDGNQWKDIIINYLPKLKIFRLKMEFHFRDRVNTTKYVDRLMNSFQTSFWIEERRWFIRCHYHPQNSSNYVCLYTLPYAFPSFPRIEVSGCQSTCPANDDQNWSYDNVHTLIYRASLTENLTLYRSRFIHLQHLVLSFDVDGQFWMMIPKFDHLISLEVSLYGRCDHARSQLQTILDRAPHLNTLKFGSWTMLDLPIGEMNNISIRQLDLRKCDRWLSNEECLALINSSLGNQCEVIRINVKNQMSIVDLVTQMPNLRSMNVRCQESSASRELINWLQDRLPSTCVITQHADYIFDILFWIR